MPNTNFCMCIIPWSINHIPEELINRPKYWSAFLVKPHGYMYQRDRANYVFITDVSKFKKNRLYVGFKIAIISGDIQVCKQTEESQKLRYNSTGTHFSQLMQDQVWQIHCKICNVLVNKHRKYQWWELPM